MKESITKLFVFKISSIQQRKGLVFSVGIFLFFINYHIAFSQQKTSTYRQDKKTADKAFDYGDYMNALEIYSKIYNADSTNNEVNYKLGACYFELKRNRKLSKKYFDKVVGSDFPEINYYLGRLNHLLGDFDKATYYYLQYKYFGGDNEHSGKEVDDLIESSRIAPEMIAKPDKSVEITNLGNQINTEYPEYVPLIPAEENFMFFTSRRKNTIFAKTDPYGNYFEDIYRAEKKDGEWQQPIMLDTIINMPFHDACTGLSADGEKLLMYRTSKDLLSGDIYESFFMDNKWSSPKILCDHINSTDFVEASACYSPDGEIIFFSSDMPGGFGGKDLYYVKKVPSGSWGKPINLGPSVNTKYNEDAPYVNPKGNELFFSSEGHKNMGGYDVFKSSFDEAYIFGPSENMGYPINTVDDDIFFVLNTSGSVGYFSSERKGGYGSQDIYKVNFLENVKNLKTCGVNVYDETEELLKQVEINLSEPSSKKLYGTFKSNPNSGKVLIISEPSKEYEVTINVDGYEPLVTKSFFKENITSFTLKKAR